jgi:hypothetical protein
MKASSKKSEQKIHGEKEAKGRELMNAKAKEEWNAMLATANLAAQRAARLAKAVPPPTTPAMRASEAKLAVQLEREAARKLNAEAKAMKRAAVHFRHGLAGLGLTEAELAEVRQVDADPLKAARWCAEAVRAALRARREARRQEVTRPVKMNAAMARKYGQAIRDALDAATKAGHEWVALDYEAQSIRSYATHPGSGKGVVMLDNRSPEEWRDLTGKLSFHSVVACLLGYPRPEQGEIQ